MGEIIGGAEYKASLFGHRVIVKATRNTVTISTGEAAGTSMESDADGNARMSITFKTPNTTDDIDPSEDPEDRGGCEAGGCGGREAAAAG